MALQALKVSGAFEKWAPGEEGRGLIKSGMQDK